MIESDVDTILILCCFYLCTLMILYIQMSPKGTGGRGVMTQGSGDYLPLLAGAT